MTNDRSSVQIFLCELLSWPFLAREAQFSPDFTPDSHGYGGGSLLAFACAGFVSGYVTRTARTLLSLLPKLEMGINPGIYDRDWEGDWFLAL
jgi:hypothetical protein